MSPDPKFSAPDRPAPIFYEPQDAPDPLPPVVVSASLFDLLATTLGASRVERDDEWAYVTYNSVDYKAALRQPVRDWLGGVA